MTDYHTFTTIDTPKDERRKMNIGDIYCNAARCLECNTVIRSCNRRHFVLCPCGSLSVDGGSWYSKRGTRSGSKGYEDKTEYYRDSDEGRAAAKEGNDASE